jgi:prepilin-type processing-associated H-X9-DG protein
MRCPSVPGGAYKPNFFGSGGEAHQPCLGLGADPTNGPIRESVIQTPSDMIGVLDFYVPLLPPLVQAGGPRVDVPHSGGIQFLLCDGHVEHSAAARFAQAQTRRRWNNDNQPHDETWLNGILNR